MFGWVEVFTSFSMGDFDKARDALSTKGIRYHFKCKNMNGGGWGQQSSLGMNFGVNMDYAIQYYLYVKKENMDDAQYLIHKAIHR